MTTEDKKEVLEDLFKDVTFFIAGDISKNVRKLTFQKYENNAVSSINRAPASYICAGICPSFDTVQL